MRVSERESVNTAWVEVQIGPNGISLSLISESPDSVGEVVENVEYLTFQELESRTGDSFELRLSDDTEELLSAKVEKRQDYDLPDYGQIVRDTNPPSRSKHERPELKVVGLPEKSAGEYIIQSVDDGQDRTVATNNPACDPDEPVVLAEYTNSGLLEGRAYAFPVSRLDW